MTTLKGKTLFITGASRGIGLAIGLRAARDGANVAIAAKTTEPHPTLPGTIYTAAEEIEKAGGKALPCATDIRSEEQIEAAIQKTVDTFGGIDVLINNASVLGLTNTLSTTSKRFDLMHQVSTRGTFLCGQKAIPHLEKSSNPHILNIAPPLNMDVKWFAPHVAYTMSKYGMSLCAYAWAEELRSKDIAANTLWPKTAIATAAVKNLLGGSNSIDRSRKPEIMGDAAYFILTKQSKEFTGNQCIDEDVLKQNGITDLDAYAVTPGVDLLPDFFV